MQKSNGWVWASTPVLLLCGLALVNCGARTSPDGDLDTSAAGGGAGASASDHGGAAGDDCKPLPPCAGGSNLEPYARLHAACDSGDATVNRSGDPVPICHHIK
ncbi:MAG: hypothetical protein WDO69_06000 [Pseudomonadota bacterium]